MEIKTLKKDFLNKFLGITDLQEIYYLGTIDKNIKRVAIVGSRNPTNYGKDVAFRFSFELAKAGVAVVSGFAPGIDTLAHLGALEAGGKTIAVLGTGLNPKVIYPKSNLKLIKQIINQGGALISQFPPETPGSKFTFPKRNKVIAQISQALIVVEAKEKSGALITAKEALKLNKKVFAIPGNISSPLSKGTNNLIKKGEAELLQNVETVLEFLGIKRESKKEEELNPVLKILSKGPKSSDEIAKELNLPINKVLMELTKLELEGKILNLGANTYAKKQL